jgi:5'-nucleotidase
MSLSRSLGLLLAAVLALGGCASEPAQPVEINLIALNDLHGYLQASPFSYVTADGESVTLKAGGVSAISGLLTELRERDPHLLLVSAGDMIGGSPPMSAMWADEPTLEALNLMGMKFSVVGNHELDHGKAELLRQVQGGCDSSRPDKACQFQADYRGTRFPYLAANLQDTDSGKLLFAPYHIEEVRGVKIGFVGALLADVGSVVGVDGMRGLRASDEAEAINAQLPELRRQGVDVVVAVVHQGGVTREAFDKQDCSELEGDVVDVAKRLDPSIRVLITGHTHQGYLCKIGGMLVTQGSSFGRLLTHLTLKVDPASGELLDVRAENLVVDPQRYTRAAPEVIALQRSVEERSQALLERPVARLGVSRISTAINAAGESPMGSLIADAQLAATRALGAQVAFMNRGGIRAGLTLEPGQSMVNFGQVASVQPFNNGLTVLSLTGAQLRELLEQQWKGAGLDGFNPLQPSASLAYSWDPARPLGQRVVVQSLRVDGQPVQPERTYRVTVNSFMADGGDNFSELTRATERLDTGLNDLDALMAYLKARDLAGDPVGRSEPDGRITRLDQGLAGGAQ